MGQATHISNILKPEKDRKQQLEKQIYGDMTF
jgi:hypothetical protein